MRPANRIVLLLDRTAVLFVGLGVGAAISLSFVGGGEQITQAQAGVPTLPQTPAAPVNQRRSDPASPRLAAALAQHRKIEIGVFGDSFGDGIWAGLYNQLRRDPDFEVRQLSERSTGFTRYRSLDILADVRAKIDRDPVDIAVLSFGANDTQGIFHEGHGNTYMSEGWQRIVTERVTAVVELLRARGAMVYWVGLPKMRDAGFDADIQQMNRFYEARMAALDVPYIETLPLSVDEHGQYAPYLPPEPGESERRLARTNDGIHMTIPAYIRVTQGLTDRIRRSVAEARAEAAPAAAPGAPGSAS
jgi:hypothetical protein